MWVRVCVSERMADITICIHVYAYASAYITHLKSSLHSACLNRAQPTKYRNIHKTDINMDGSVPNNKQSNVKY